MNCLRHARGFEYIVPAEEKGNQGNEKMDLDMAESVLYESCEAGMHRIVRQQILGNAIFMCANLNEQTQKACILPHLSCKDRYFMDSMYYATTLFRFYSIEVR